MTSVRIRSLWWVCLFIGISTRSSAQSAGPADVRDLDTPREFPVIASRAAWETRAQQIREQVLVSCGLWPLPEKVPLDPHVFGKVQRDGYTVEKVYLRSLPGFYLAGNLYRPSGRGRGPFPGILNPHGHWAEGRLTDTADGSVPARCINFARQGMVAFAYDMVGYNDTHFADTPANLSFDQAHHQIATSPSNLLWNITLMGLQTWNSIRALDFLESFPGVDRKRLACTGGSGGGTQTFMLGAIDGRLAAQAPVVMVSHLMQGGCLCENAPGLRVEYSNMEIDAAAAPRPQLIVAATGDWTRDTPRVEGPAIEHIYQLFGAGNRFQYVQFDFGHNYNQTSREAVYAWFNQRFLRGRGAVKEVAYRMEPRSALRVFPDGRLPLDALTQGQLIAQLKQSHRAAWEKLVPSDLEGLNRFKHIMFPAWRHTLLVDWPQSRTELKTEPLPQENGFTRARFELRRSGEAGVILAQYWAPPGLETSRAPKLVVLSGPGLPPEGMSGLASKILQTGAAVLAVQRFSSGAPPDQFANFYTTYNRTESQRRVRDLLTLCSAADSLVGGSVHFRVILWGQGVAGIWSLLAAPAADAVIADGVTLDCQNEQAWLAPDLFCPGILNLNGYFTAAMLAAPHPLLLHNTGEHFAAAALRAAYASAGAGPKLRIESRPLSEGKVLAWIQGL